MENNTLLLKNFITKLKKNYLILIKKYNIVVLAFQKSRLAFKKLLKNYLIINRKYLLIRKHTTEKVRELIDKIDQEKFQIVFDQNRKLIKISKTFLEAIDMDEEEFTHSFYIDVLFQKYLPSINPQIKYVEIKPFQFPILIKNQHTARNHLHPYLYFNVRGRLLSDQKYNIFLYQLSFHDVSASVELDYFQKTDSLVTSLSLSNYNLSKAMKTIEMHKIMLIFLTCSLIEEYNRETSTHIQRIKQVTTILSEECKRMSLIKVDDYDFEEYVKDINFTSVLHDIGKMGISNDILFKDSALTAEEKKIMQTHTKIGAAYIQKIIDFFKNNSDYSSYLKFLQIPYEICLYHHERWDGKGYLSKLKGEEIPIAARIVSVADTYDAIRAKRIYDPSRSHQEAVEIIKNEAGKQFDPNIVEAFLNVEPLISQIRYEESA